MRRAIEAHLGTGQVARVIYGAIIGLALVVVLEAHPPTAWVMVASLLGTAVAVGLAELYSEVVGVETRTRQLVHRAQIGHIVDDVVAVVLGVAFPAVFFFLAAVGAFEVDTAFKLAKWTGLGLVTFYGFCAGRLAGAGVGGALLHALVVGLVGGALVLLKALVH